MTQEDRTATAAQTILVSAFRIVFPSADTRISAINDIVSALAGTKSSRWAQRDISRQLEASSDKLAQRLADFEQHEFRDLDEGDKDAAISVACESVDALHLTRQQVIDKDAKADAIYAMLEPTAVRLWKQRLLSEDGTEYGRVFLTEASRFITNIVRDMPDFTKDVALSNLTITRQILNLLQQSIDSVVLPRYRAGTPIETSTFEADYRSDIIQRNKDVELFGVHIPIPELRRQPLDIAYITLSATSKSDLEKAPQSRDAYRNPLSPSYASQLYRASINSALAAVIRRNMDSSSQMRQGVRILVTGTAGSGKTTLTQWLALRCAKADFTGDLTLWNTCLPFVLKLRNLFHREINEDPDRLELLETAINRSSRMPGDWIISTLQKRRTVLLLDGLDELSEYHLSIARKWLENFLHNYPKVNVIVTSRPEGLDQRWFNLQGFTTFSLEPMSIDSIKECIEAWFKAVDTVAPEMGEDLLAHKRSLLHDVKNRPSVRELAETPLVCAMLCAFYAYEVSESAPESRGELYEQLIETLVDKRDRVRNAIHRERRRFTSNEKLTFLQALARYLTEHELLSVPTRWSAARQTQARREGATSSIQTALSIIEAEARGLAAMSLSPSDALDYLLQRSVIFREVAAGEAQFVHRSIQEFLTARSFAASGQFDLLLRHIGSAQWNGIISFAAARLDFKDATKLINAILDRAESDKNRARDLLLLAAECLSTARVEPELVDRAAQALKAILPPRSMHEAELLGRSGEGVIRWLSNYAHESEDTVAVCLHAAAVTGSPAGLSVIVDYLPHIRSRQLKLALIDAWRYFDVTEYAEAVLSQVSFGDCAVRFANIETLSVAPIIRDLQKIEIALPLGVTYPVPWNRLTSLRDLDCSKFQGLESVAGLGNINGLLRLNLSNRSRITDFDEVGLCVNLRELYLDSCIGLTDANFLAGLTALRVLSVNRCVGLRDFDWLTRCERLLTLSLNGCGPASLSFVSALSKLRVLRAETADGTEDFSSLQACGDLKRLSFSLPRLRRGSLELPSNLPLESLSLSGIVSTDDLSCLSGFPALTEFTAIGVKGLEDLVPLSNLPGLRVLRLRDCSELTSCNGIERLANLQKLELVNCSTRYPSIPRSLENLKEINLDDCEYLGSIEEVIWLPSLERLTLPPMDSSVLSWMESQAANPALVVYCDPIPGGYETG